MKLIEFTGKVHKDAVPAVLDRADIFINTTTVDNLPTSVLEAFACGLCVVSTNVGGIPFLVKHGMDGFLVPPGDPDAMAAAVIRILKEPGLAGKLSTNGRRKAGEFDWGAVLPRWKGSFESLTETGPGMNARLGKALYFSLQRLRREPVAQALEDVLQTGRLSRTELLDLQAARLIQHLRYAVEHVPHYRQAFEPFKERIKLREARGTLRS